MRRCQSNSSIFLCNTFMGSIILVVYVDDIMVTRSDSAGVLYCHHRDRHQALISINCVWYFGLGTLIFLGLALD